MIALDSSAIIAILIAESFARIIRSSGAAVGAPTMVEVRLALEGRVRERSETLLRGFLESTKTTVFPFDAAIEAFARFGKGRGHKANLNFGDCLSYAFGRASAVPLLFKGSDFVHTDIVPAYSPTP